MTAFAAAVVVAAALHYEVKVSGDARDLAIEARIAPFPDREGELSVSGGAEEFVREVAILSPEGEVRLERRKDSWFAPGCAARSRFSYCVSCWRASRTPRTLHSRR